MKKEFWLIFPLILMFILIVVFGPAVRLIITTNSPPAYMIKNLEEQIKCAKNIGFKIGRPILRVMKEPPDWNESKGYAFDVWPRGLVLLAPYTSYQTMAHELGHITDFQTDRKGHPIFEQIKDLPTEAFANAIKDRILAECQKPENRR